MLLTVVVSLGLTIGLFLFMRHWEHRDNQAEFEFGSRHYVEAIRRATGANRADARDHAAGLITVRPKCPETNSHLCCEPILARVPSLKVLQWAPRVAHDDRDDFEQAARREGWPKYRIIEPDLQGQLVPARSRDEYFPIWYAASKCGFEARFGWDFAADPVLHGRSSNAATRASSW